MFLSKLKNNITYLFFGIILSISFIKTGLSSGCHNHGGTCYIMDDFSHNVFYKLNNHKDVKTSIYSIIDSVSGGIESGNRKFKTIFNDQFKNFILCPSCSVSDISQRTDLMIKIARKLREEIKSVTRFKREETIIKLLDKVANENPSLSTYIDTLKENKFLIKHATNMQSFIDYLDQGISRLEKHQTLFTNLRNWGFKGDLLEDLFSWPKAFSTSPQQDVINLRRLLFPKMHKLRGTILSLQDIFTGEEVLNMHRNWAKRLKRNGHTKISAMFPMNQIQRFTDAGMDISKIKEIFRKEGVELKLSLKINSITVPPNRRTKYKPLGDISSFDEIDIFASSNEHTTTPNASLKSIDQLSWDEYYGKEILDWAKQKNPPRISFHMFEGDNTPSADDIKKWFEKLKELDQRLDRKLHIVFNHSMTLPNKSYINDFLTHFEGRVTISFQPSTYKILASKTTDEIALQLKRLISTNAPVLFGADDPGLYKGYGKPSDYFKDLFLAKNSERFILNDSDIIKILDGYHKSVGSQNLDSIHTLHEIFDTIKYDQKTKRYYIPGPPGKNRYFDNTKELRTALGSFIHC